MNLIEQAKHEEQVRASFEVAGVGRFSLGRDPNCDWVLPDPTRSISARHCEIVSDGASYTLRDLSTNGVFLNSASERLDHAHKLRDGDVFALGRYIVKAWLADGANAARDASAPPLAARRGGDPAAMLAQPDRPISGQSPHQPGCVDTGMTMIRPPPRNVAAPAPSPAPPLDASSSRPEPASPAAPPAVTDVWGAPPGSRIELRQAKPAAIDLAPLTDGLALDRDAFAGVDPADVLRRAGAVTLALAAGVKALIDESVRARRAIGSRRLATPFGLGAEVSDFADSPSQVVARLIAGDGAIDAIVRGVFKEISDHQRGVTEAALTAARRLGEELAPAALGAEAHSLECKAHLWDLYCVLWRALDPDWAAAFLEAYRLHFGEAYDDVTVYRHLSSAEPRP